MRGNSAAMRTVPAMTGKPPGRNKLPATWEEIRDELAHTEDEAPPPPWLPAAAGGGGPHALAGKLQMRAQQRQPQPLGKSPLGPVPGGTHADLISSAAWAQLDEYAGFGDGEID